MRSNNSRYIYEEAKRKAIKEMHRYMRMHLRDIEKFQFTGDIWYKHRGAYYKDMADQLASSWNMRIVSFSMGKLEVRELGI